MVVTGTDRINFKFLLLEVIVDFLNLPVQFFYVLLVYNSICIVD